MPRIIILEGPEAGLNRSFPGASIKIGRSTENDLALTDGAVSRLHAEIFERDGCWHVRDRGSTHGTFVNETRNSYEMRLDDQDELRLGGTRFRFEIDPAVEKTLNPAIVQPVNLKGGETVAFSLEAGQMPEAPSLAPHHNENLARVAEALRTELELQPLLERLMDLLFDIFKPDRGILFLMDPEKGLQKDVVRPEGQDFQVSHSVIDHAVENRRALLVGDTAEDQRFNAAESIMTQAIQSAICAPLLSRDAVLGVIYLDSRSRPISYLQEDLALLNILAVHAAMSIENALLVQQKVEAERLAAVGVAVAGISHYVKNILTGMTSSSQLIAMGLESDNLDILKSTWPVMQRATKKIKGLVQDMLSYSKKREPNWQEGNLNAIARDAFDNQKSRAEELDIQLETELDAALPDSHFDPHTIHDTTLNILGNAVEACEGIPEARVTVRTGWEPEKKTLRLEVEDNGPGIPEDIQKKIFEPFFSTKGSKGTGLGLAIARKSLEEHGGSLLLRSTPGQGACFTLILPPGPPEGESPS